MLLNQAVPAFEMWHHKKVTVSEYLKKIALDHLEGTK
jgi:shikimate 5-dehydrogenase